MTKVREEEFELLEKTLNVWQPRASKSLTREDARQITDNVAGFFWLLQKWEQAESSIGATNETAKILAPQKEVL